MKKNYICPTVLIVNVEKDALLAGSPTEFTITSGRSTSDDSGSGSAEWADAKGGHVGFYFDDDFSDDLNW